MRRRNRKTVVAFVAAFVVAAAVPAVVVATTTTIIVPDATELGVTVRPKLGVNSAVRFSTTIGFITITSTCTDSHWSFVANTQAGLGPFALSYFNTTQQKVLPSNPTFSSCADNIGGTDTITTSRRGGNWTVRYTNPDPGTAGDTNHLQLTIPKAGATITSTSSAAANCTLTVSPAGDTVTGAYDNEGNLTFWNQTLHYSAGNTDPTKTPCTLNGDSGTGTFSVVQADVPSNPGSYEVTPKIFGIG